MKTTLEECHASILIRGGTARPLTGLYYSHPPPRPCGQSRLYNHLLFLLAAMVLLIGTNAAQAGRRAYGVSGDRGTAVATPRGVAWSGENSSGAVTHRGGAVATDNGVAVANRRGVAVAGDNGAAVATRPIAPVAVVRPLPSGYIRTVPVGYSRVVYGGYNCYFVGGVYYRAVMYEGATVYVVVT